MPEKCDRFGDPFTFCHSLDCRVGGLVTQCCNEIRDALGDITAMVHKEVLHEPAVWESSDADGVPALIADLGVCGAWQPQDNGIDECLYL